jgi:hypothetical protein
MGILQLKQGSLFMKCIPVRVFLEIYCHKDLPDH